MKQIAAAFVKAQKNFAPALKTNTNPHFRSKYADLSACVEAVIDALNDAGIALIQQTHECSDGVTVETVFMHESGDTLNCGKLHVPASKQDPQGYGSALTYARRYSLMAACGIAPEDDDGNAASKKPEQRADAQKPAGMHEKEESDWSAALASCSTTEELVNAWEVAKDRCKLLGDRPAAERLKKLMMTRHTALEQVA